MLRCHLRVIIYHRTINMSVGWLVAWRWRAKPGQVVMWKGLEEPPKTRWRLWRKALSCLLYLSVELYKYVRTTPSITKVSRLSRARSLCVCGLTTGHVANIILVQCVYVAETASQPSTENHNNELMYVHRNSRTEFVYLFIHQYAVVA